MPLNLATADDLAARDTRLAGLESRAGALESRVAALEPAVTLLQAQVALLIEKVLHLPDPPPEEDPPAPADPILARSLVTTASLKLVGGWRYPSNVGGVNPTTAFSAKNLSVRTNTDGAVSFWNCWGNLYETKSTGAFGTDADPTKWPLLTAVGAHPANETYQKVFNFDPTNDDPYPLGCLRVSDGVLISGLSGYAAPVPTDPFLMKLRDDGATEGPWGLPGGMCQVFGGGLCRVPQWFADKYLGGGEWIVAGRGGYQSGQGSTAGASAAFVKLDTLAEKTPLKVVLQFGDFGGAPKILRENRPADYSTPVWGPAPDGDVGYFTTDRVLSEPFWIDAPGVRGLCYLVLQPVGPCNYSWQTETFGTSTRVMLYVYDELDLAAVLAGTKQPHEIRGKYYPWPNPLPGVVGTQTTNGQHRPEGAVWHDGRLYVLHRWVWGGTSEYAPVIAVYEVL